MALEKLKWEDRMDKRWILPVSEYYARLNAYILEIGLPYSIEDCQGWQEEAALLRPVIGEGQGQAVLDCSCGWGKQAVALAKLGWQVSACDVSETSLEFARQLARREDVPVDFRFCDMRDLVNEYHQQFDWVVSCYALYEIPTRAEIRRAVQGMFHALKPGGKCYLRFRDMDFLMEEQPRHEYRGEKRVPNGRIICLEDWDFESETSVVALNVFMREDERKDSSDHFRWVTETIGCRKNVMRKAELRDLFLGEGFDPFVILPQSAPWFPVQVVATRPV